MIWYGMRDPSISNKEKIHATPNTSALSGFDVKQISEKEMYLT